MANVDDSTDGWSSNTFICSSSIPISKSSRVSKQKAQAQEQKEWLRRGVILAGAWCVRGVLNPARVLGGGLSELASCGAPGESQESTRGATAGDAFNIAEHLINRLLFLYRPLHIARRLCNDIVISST